jgi:hypothetical protein
MTETFASAAAHRARVMEFARFVGMPASVIVSHKNMSPFVQTSLRYILDMARQALLLKFSGVEPMMAT